MGPVFSNELWNSSQHVSKARTGLRLSAYRDTESEVPITHDGLRRPLGAEIALAGARKFALLLSFAEAHRWASAAQRT
jgi:hypothetical protein